MEYVEKLLKKSGWISIIESIIFAILGAILIANPEGTFKFISWIIGAIFIGVGVSKAIKYFTAKGKSELYNNEFIYSIIAVILGIVTIVYSSTIGSFFRIIIGIWIIYSSLIRLNYTMKLKDMDNSVWIYSLVLAILMFLCGLYITLNSGAVMVTIGITMIVSSVLDIVEDIIIMQNIK